MHQAPALLLTALVALGSDSVPAQTNTTVLVRMASEDTCLVAAVHVSCRELGAKMRELGIPLNAQIQFGIDGYRSYEAIRVMMDSIRRAGYKVDKVGFLTEPQP
jgi:biopolymer transport protein ExbD